MEDKTVELYINGEPLAEIKNAQVEFYQNYRYTEKNGQIVASEMEGPMKVNITGEWYYYLRY